MMKISKILSSLIVSSLIFSVIPTANAEPVSEPQFQSCSLPYSASKEISGISIPQTRIVEPQCGGIPNSLMLSARVVNLNKFTVRFESGKIRDPKTRWYIERDRAGHADRYYKLKSPDGRYIFSLWRDGRINK